MNIFKGLLTEEKMKRITNGSDCGARGDYLAWDPEQWQPTKETVRYFDIEKDNLCFYFGKRRLLKLTRRYQLDAIYGCSKFGGARLPNVASDENLKDFLNLAQKEDFFRGVIEDRITFKPGWIEPQKYEVTHLGYYYDSKKKSYLNILDDYYFNTSTSRVNKYFLDLGYSGGIVQYQDRFNTSSAGILWQINRSPTFLSTVTCCLKNQIRFFLRGVCKSSVLWPFTGKYHLIPENGISTEVLIYVGQSTKLYYNHTQGVWVMWQHKFNHEPRYLATVKASQTNMALGANTWTVNNDAKECNTNNGDTYDTILTLSACSEDQFTCKDGNCVRMEQRCDGRSDCYDESDEMECKIIKLKSSYSVGISPPPQKYRNKSDIFVSIDIKDILELDEIGKVFQVKFILYLTWIDSRLTYQNLKKDPNLNVLLLEDQKKIWTPAVIFSNTKDDDRTQIDEYTLVRVLPNEDFLYTKSDMSVKENIFYFKGSENILELSRTYRVDFLCNYDMALYPFDTQICSLNFEQDKAGVKSCNL